MRDTPGLELLVEIDSKFDDLQQFTASDFLAFSNELAPTYWINQYIYY